jgi:hypothetical protein
MGRWFRKEKALTMMLAEMGLNQNENVKFKSKFWTFSKIKI